MRRFLLFRLIPRPEIRRREDAKETRGKEIGDSPGFVQ